MPSTSRSCQCHGTKPYGSGSSGSYYSGGSSKVYASGGDTNVRSGPGLDYKQLGTLKQGCTLDYLGTTTYDARGVAWYSVDYNGGTGWVSSKYTELW